MRATLSAWYKTMRGTFGKSGRRSRDRVRPVRPWLTVLESRLSPAGLAPLTAPDHV